MNDLVPMSPRALDRVFAQPLPNYFTYQEAQAILSANTHDLRAYALVNTLWKTGARISEVLGLRRRDLDPYGKTLRFETLKQGSRVDRKAGPGRKRNPQKTMRQKERLVPIPDDLTASLMSWVYGKEGAPEGPIFAFSRVTAFRVVREACGRAGFFDERAHPHTFRHSYAVHLLREGVPVTVLRDLLGHSSISSTLVYLRITQPDARAILAQVRW